MWINHDFCDSFFVVNRHTVNNTDHTVRSVSVSTSADVAAQLVTYQLLRLL